MGRCNGGAASGGRAAAGAAGAWAGRAPGAGTGQAGPGPGPPPGGYLARARKILYPRLDKYFFGNYLGQSPAGGATDRTPLPAVKSRRKISPALKKNRAKAAPARDCWGIPARVGCATERNGWLIGACES